MKFSPTTLLLAAPLLAAACGGPLTYAIHGTPMAPEADAKLVADVHKDGDFTTLKVEATNLAAPDRLGGSGGTTFVVWTKGTEPKWHRVGALKYEAGDHKASLEGASVPVTSFDFKVTVEKSAEPEIPSDTVVLSQHVN
jgi:hypothetical protein